MEVMERCYKGKSAYTKMHCNSSQSSLHLGLPGPGVQTKPKIHVRQINVTANQKTTQLRPKTVC